MHKPTRIVKPSSLQNLKVTNRTLSQLLCLLWLPISTHKLLSIEHRKKNLFMVCIASFIRLCLAIAKREEGIKVMQLNFRTGEFNLWLHEVAWLLAILFASLGGLSIFLFHDTSTFPFLFGLSIYFVFFGAVARFCEHPKKVET